MLSRALWLAVLPTLLRASGGECESRQRGPVQDCASHVQRAVHSSSVDLRESEVLRRRLESARGSCITLPTENSSEASARIERLAFVHVPRTGGTTVESCSQSAPEALRWGVANPAIRGHREKEVTKCFLQHAPPSQAPQFYEGRDTFCVVRDPYQRAVSQHGFMSMFFPNKWSCNATSLNAYLRGRLPTLAKSPYQDDCHLLPQAAYVHRWSAQAKAVDLRGPRGCGNFLRFENLSRSFNATMESYGLPYRLNSLKTISSGTMSSKRCHELSPRDLEEDVRRLIEEVYRVDFEVLGYPRLAPRRRGLWPALKFH